MHILGIVVGLFVVLYLVGRLLGSKGGTQCDHVALGLSSTFSGVIDESQNCKDAKLGGVQATQLGTSPETRDACQAGASLALVRRCVALPYKEIKASAQTGIRQPFLEGQFQVIRGEAGKCVWKKTTDGSVVPPEALVVLWRPSKDPARYGKGLLLNVTAPHVHVTPGDEASADNYATLSYMTYANAPKSASELPVVCLPQAITSPKLALTGACLKGQPGWDPTLATQFIDTSFPGFNDGKCAAVVSLANAGTRRVLSISSTLGSNHTALVPNFGSGDIGKVPPMVQFVTVHEATDNKQRKIEAGYALRIVSGGVAYFLHSIPVPPAADCLPRYSTSYGSAKENNLLFPLICANASSKFAKVSNCVQADPDRPYCLRDKCSSSMCTVKSDCEALSKLYHVDFECVSNTCLPTGGLYGFYTRPSQVAQTDDVTRTDAVNTEKKPVKVAPNIYEANKNPCIGVLPASMPDFSGGMCFETCYGGGQCSHGEWDPRGGACCNRRNDFNVTTNCPTTGCAKGDWRCIGTRCAAASGMSPDVKISGPNCATPHSHSYQSSKSKGAQRARLVLRNRQGFDHLSMDQHQQHLRTHSGYMMSRFGGDAACVRQCSRITSSLTITTEKQAMKISPCTRMTT